MKKIRFDGHLNAYSGRKRPPFRRESGRHSAGKKATIPEQSGQ
jgi:hypothetical protein